MVSTMERAWDAVEAGWSAAQRVWSRPQDMDTAPVPVRLPYYERMWAYYTNTAFTNLATAQLYRDVNGLYTNHRQVYNVTGRLVDFYVDEIWPGVLSDDGRPLPAGVPTAIPFASDMSKALMLACAQLFQWGNFQDIKDLIVRYTGALGVCLCEWEDDLAHGKVTPRIWFPSRVTDIVEDATGNIKLYSLAYMVEEMDAAGKPTGAWYKYSKTVTSKTVSTFKNDKPFDYTGFGEVYENPYGFCPAVQFKFFNMGNDFGQPIIWRNMPKIDELDGLASAAHDQAFKIIRSPIVVTGGNPEQSATKVNKEKAARDANPVPTNKNRAQEIELIHLPMGSQVLSLPLDLGQMLDMIVHSSEELEKEYPELIMYQQLRGMSSVTGPAANRLLGDVVKRVSGRGAVFDQQMKKFLEMGVAIGGMRANGGLQGWGNRKLLTEMQAVFLPFGLDSYAARKINVTIEPRPLVAQVQAEKWAAEESMSRALVAKKQIGVPDAQLQEEAGYTPEQISKFADEAQKAAAESQEALGKALLKFNAGNGSNPQPDTQPNTLPTDGGTNQ